jgi:hypothetical protein
MSIQQVINGFDIDLFRAKTHFNLRHNSISSDNWEKAIADATGSRWIKGSADLADAFNKQEKVAISVKSRKFDPQIKKTISSRDFMSNPAYFHLGGNQFSEGDLDNLHTVSGRCSIPGLDEQMSAPEDIGKVAISRYTEFEQKSLDKFDCDETLDAVIVHGESKDLKNYLVRIMFFDHTLNKVVRWHDEIFNGPRTKYKGNRAMILGYDNHGPHIGRISNLGRQQTCMLRFYRKSEALHIINTTIPMPVSEKFNFKQEFAAMNK